MTEIKTLAGILVLLMVGAYVSWHHEEDAGKEEMVTLVNERPEAFQGLTMVTTTQTVTMSLKETDAERRVWFEVESSKGTKRFAGNEKAEKLVDTLAPFRALRSLGANLSEDELKATGLDAPKRRLSLRFEGGERQFELGGRTSGSQDHYARKAGGQEVVLLASRTIANLEFPSSPYMQRKLREGPDSEVEKIELSASGKTLRLLHKNRLSPQDAYWVPEGKGQSAKNETFENYLGKLSRLTAMEYLADAKAFESAEPILEVAWYGADGKRINTLSVRKQGAEKGVEYLAQSTRTGHPVRISRFAGERAEKDLDSVFSAADLD